MLNVEQIQGIVRHVLGAAGIWFAARGYADDATIQTVIGAATAVVATLWSVISKPTPPKA